jgi:hypothetical protein
MWQSRHSAAGEAWDESCQLVVYGFISWQELQKGLALV